MFEALFEILVEGVIRIPGYFLLKHFRDSEVDFEGNGVFWTGIGYWVVVLGAVAVVLYFVLR
jgi:hypothetical protein